MKNCGCGGLVLYVWLVAGHVTATPTVGAYYYPWWGEGIAGGHTFDQTLRAHLTPESQLPAVGLHNSRDASVISTHIDQSHLGNISMWSLSWWGPTSFEDRSIRNHILPHPRASELSYTIHYESTGRLGNFSSPNYGNLIPDFRHLAENVFSDPNYMRIDGRPVVVMYLSRVYFDDAAGATALADLRTAMQQEFGYDPYIIGDHVFGLNVPGGVANLDAITAFDVYGQVFNNGISDQRSVDDLERIFARAQATADNLGVDFVPSVSPGFNDKGVRDGHAPAPRYFTAVGPTEPGSVMAALLEDAALPHTDVDINELIMVNSFNEWHEDTQIEPTVISALTDTDDSSSGAELTVGRFYEGYGNRYLDILRHATGVHADFDGDGDVDGDDFLAWQSGFGTLSDARKSDGDYDNDGDVDGDDFLGWQSEFGSSSGVASAIVPEPASMVLLIVFAASGMLSRQLPRRLS